MSMKLRGVRGATTVEVNTAESILEATRTLLQELIEINGIEEEDVTSVFFTMTQDLNAAFPAKAARDLGWSKTALLGMQEVDVPNGIPMCVRILIHWNTERSLDEIRHVYSKGALILRPDLYPENKIILPTEEKEKGN